MLGRISLFRLRRTAAGAAALVGASVLAALPTAAHAVGGSSSRASWQVAANRACAASNARIRALPKPTTDALYLTDLRGTLRISKQLTSRLAKIPARRFQQAAIDTLLTTARTEAGIMEHALLPALLAGDVSRVRRVAAELKPLDTRYNRIARSLGARICAESPSPRG